MNTVIKVIPLLYLAGGIAAVFVIMKLIKESKAGLTAAGESLAEAIVSTRGVPAVISGQSDDIVLPNGQRITWKQVIAAGSKLASDNTFVWQGVRFRVIKRGSDGAWQTETAF